MKAREHAWSTISSRRQKQVIRKDERGMQNRRKRNREQRNAKHRNNQLTPLRV